MADLNQICVHRCKFIYVLTLNKHDLLSSIVWNEERHEVPIVMFVRGLLQDEPHTSQLSRTVKILD